MKRRSRAGSAKSRRSKPAAIKRHRTPASRHHSGHRPDQSNEQLRRELDEAREQQAATTDVLRIVSASSGEVKPVFEAILNKAVRICEANFGILGFYEGDSVFRPVAMHNLPAAYAQRVAERRDRSGYRPHPMGAVGRVAATKRVVHVFDYREELAYKQCDPIIVDIVELGGARTLVAVPMLKEDTLIGAIVIYRQQIRPFTDKQIALVQNFAAQAVIAIQNSRLFNELRQRTTDLSASLEQQTATSEVLRVISSSQGELQPVFEAMLANAVRLCEAKFGVLYRYDGHPFHPEALLGAPQPLVEFHQRRGAFETVPGTPLHRLWQTREVVHTADDAGSPSASARFGGARSHLAVPMFKGDALVGSIIIYRQEVRPFIDKQVDLVKNFAAQAVIAIENARLLGELRKRTSDLSEALEQQTATSDVLRVISASPGSLEPVFQAMLENAVRICDAKFGIMWRYDNEAFAPIALFGAPERLAEFVRQRGRFQPPAGTALDLI